MDENRGTSAEDRPTSVHDAIVSLSNRDHSIDSVTFCLVLRISLLVCGRVCIHAPFQLPFAPSPRFIRRRTTETTLCKQAGQKAERHRAVPGNIFLATARLQKFCRNYALSIFWRTNKLFRHVASVAFAEHETHETQRAKKTRREARGKIGQLPKEESNCPEQKRENLPRLAGGVGLKEGSVIVQGKGSICRTIRLLRAIKIEATAETRDHGCRSGEVDREGTAKRLFPIKELGLLPATPTASPTRSRSPERRSFPTEIGSSRSTSPWIVAG